MPEDTLYKSTLTLWLCDHYLKVLAFGNIINNKNIYIG